MSIYLDRGQYERCRGRLQANNSPSPLPTSNPPPGSAPRQRTIPNWEPLWATSLFGSLRIVSPPWHGQGSTRADNSTAPVSPALNLQRMLQKESYLCTDKYWGTIRETNMYAVPAGDTVKDDCTLFIHIQNALAATRGSWSWPQRFVSSRDCTRVELSEVSEYQHSQAKSFFF